MSVDFSGRLAPGLERSCNEATADWIRHDEAVAGVALLEAWFQGAAYRPHRHDTYAIGVTETGVQAFRYRGASRISTHASRFEPSQIPGDTSARHAANAASVSANAGRRLRVTVVSR